MLHSRLAAGSLIRWDAKSQFAECVVEHGKTIQLIGFTRGGKRYLYAEEALFMLQRGLIEMLFNDVPLSLEDGYALLSQSVAPSRTELDSARSAAPGFNRLPVPYLHSPLESYMAYRHLKQLGYTLFRTGLFDAAIDAAAVAAAVAAAAAAEAAATDDAAAAGIAPPPAAATAAAGAAGASGSGSGIAARLVSHRELIRQAITGSATGLVVAATATNTNAAAKPATAPAAAAAPTAAAPRVTPSGGSGRITFTKSAAAPPASASAAPPPPPPPPPVIAAGTMAVFVANTIQSQSPAAAAVFVGLPPRRTPTSNTRIRARTPARSDVAANGAAAAAAASTDSDAAGGDADARKRQKLAPATAAAAAAPAGDSESTAVTAPAPVPVPVVSAAEEALAYTKLQSLIPDYEWAPDTSAEAAVADAAAAAAVAAVSNTGKADSKSNSGGSGGGSASGMYDHDTYYGWLPIRNDTFKKKAPAAPDFVLVVIPSNGKLAAAAVAAAAKSTAKWSQRAAGGSASGSGSGSSGGAGGSSIGDATFTDPPSTELEWYYRTLLPYYYPLPIKFALVQHPKLLFFDFTPHRPEVRSSTLSASHAS